MRVLGFVRKWSWEFASLALVLAGVGAYLVIHALPTDASLTLGERVQIGDGVSFTAPHGWDQSVCSDAWADCVEVSPAHAGDGDVISASLLIGPISFEGDSPFAFLSFPELPPGGQRITIDEVAGVRFDGAEVNDSLLAVFAVLSSEDVFFLICEFDRWESEIREGCEMIIETLTLRPWVRRATTPSDGTGTLPDAA